jgi:hypothetical protein
MAKAIEDLFFYLLFLTDILIIVFFFIFFKKNRTEKGLWAITIYCFIDLVVNLLGEAGLTYSVMATLYALFTFIEYSTFAYFLWLHIKNPLFRKLIIIISIVFSIFLAIYNKFYGIRSLDSVPIGIETILILIFIFYYLFEQANDKTNLFIYSHYQFWAVTGFMIYLAGSFFIYILANQINRELLERYWFLTNALYVVKNLFIGVAFFINIKKKRLNPRKFRPYLN